MLGAGRGWKLFFWVEFAFGVALLIMTFIFVEETRYFRNPALVPSGSVTPPTEAGVDTIKAKVEAEEMRSVDDLDERIPPRKTMMQQLNPWSGIDHDAEFFMTALRSFTYYLVPVALWVNTTYGKSHVL